MYLSCCTDFASSAYNAAYITWGGEGMTRKHFLSQRRRDESARKDGKVLKKNAARRSSSPGERVLGDATERSPKTAWCGRSASSGSTVMQRVAPSQVQQDASVLDPYDWGPDGRPKTRSLTYIPGVGFSVGQD